MTFVRTLTVGLATSVFLAVPTYAVTFTYDFADPAGTGFNDATYGPARQQALEAAGNIWGGLLSDSYAGETIHVQAIFQSQGGTSTSAPLASAGPSQWWTATNGPVAPLTIYPDALTNHIIGTDVSFGNPNPGVLQYEINVFVNSDIGNPSVLNGQDFYYGTDGNAAGNQFDFVSILLHEFGHGLGLLSGFNQDGSYGFTYDDDNNGNTPKVGIPTIYDWFLSSGDPTQPGSTPITSLDQTGRANAFVSNDLYWNGTYGILGNGGDAPQLFAPTTYQTGSSLSHPDETAYPLDLMSPIYSGVDHMPSAMDLGMLRDIGWTVVPEPTGMAMIMLLGAALTFTRRRRSLPG